MANEDFDINTYYNPFEPEEQWELKKKFMEAYKDMFDEPRLVCLAQVLVNIEFLGCRYPADTMRQVAELSRGIVEELRERQKTRLQRTFVGAADAASAKVKGRMTAQINTIQTQSASISVHVDDRTEVKKKKQSKGHEKVVIIDESEEAAQGIQSKMEVTETGQEEGGNGVVEKKKKKKKRKVESGTAAEVDQPAEKRKMINQPVVTPNIENSEECHQKAGEEAVDQADDTAAPKKKRKRKKKTPASTEEQTLENPEESQQNAVDQADDPAAPKKKKKKKKKTPVTAEQQAKLAQLAAQEPEEEAPGATVYDYNLPDFVLVIRENKSLWKAEGKNLRARAVLNSSATINDLRLTETKKQAKSGMWHYTLTLGDTPLAKAVHEDEQKSKTMAAKAALAALKKTQYSVVLKDLRDEDELVTVGASGEQEEKISDSNVGFKLMKMMGWSGGGLGSKEQGIVDPVEQKTIVGRSGLGLKQTKASFEVDVRRYLTDYSKSDSNRDLVFDTGYSNEERKFIHLAARRLGLRSKSHNVMGEKRTLTRQLIVSRPVMKTRKLIQIVRDHMSSPNAMSPGAFGDKIEIIPPSTAE